MRENRLSGSEGGATSTPSSLPLSIVWSLRDKMSDEVPVPTAPPMPLILGTKKPALHALGVLG